MDEKEKEEIRKLNSEMGVKIGVGFKGRLPGELPQPPGYIPDPEPTKPPDPRCFPDSKNPNITQPKKEK